MMMRLPANGPACRNGLKSPESRTSMCASRRVESDQFFRLAPRVQRPFRPASPSASAFPAHQLSAAPQKGSAATSPHGTGSTCFRSRVDGGSASCNSEHPLQSKPGRLFFSGAGYADRPENDSVSLSSSTKKNIGRTGTSLILGS
jgi:hypothetical protein